MIISASIGMGKTTLSLKDKNIIDLDISTFSYSSPTRVTDFCATALYLEKQGYIVLTGTNRKVIDSFLSMGLDNYFIISFDINMKENVVQKLEERYKITKNVKDKHALNSVKQYFNENVEYIKNLNQNNIIWVNNENYNLEQIILTIRGVA